MFRLGSPPPPAKTRRPKGGNQASFKGIVAGSNSQELNDIFDSSDFDRALQHDQKPKPSPTTEKATVVHRDVPVQPQKPPSPDTRKMPAPPNASVRIDPNPSDRATAQLVSNGGSVSSNKTSRCPICGQEFESLRLLGVHIDDRHPSLLTPGEESRREDESSKGHTPGSDVADKSVVEPERAETRKEKMGKREKLRGLISGINVAKEGAGRKSRAATVSNSVQLYR